MVHNIRSLPTVQCCDFEQRPCLVPRIVRTPSPRQGLELEAFLLDRCTEFLDAGGNDDARTRAEKLRAAIEKEGFELKALPWRRRSHNPWNEARALFEITALYRRERPDIVHHVACLL